MESCPNDMKPYNKMIEMQRKQQDIHNYNLGKYVEIAVASAIGMTFGKSNTQSIYPKKPFLQEIEEEAKMSQKAKEKKVEELFLRLKIMQHNFEQSKK